MIARLRLGAAALAFLIVATANSGGYRYGISDQAFYVPAVARAVDGTLFPRDTALLAPQMRWWAGDEAIAGLLRVVPVDLPSAFAVLYVLGVLLLFGASVFFMRGLGASWWAVAGATALLTLRHRIAKTGANSLEGYMHPRMIAFAIGVLALGCVLRKRTVTAIVLVALAAVVHPTTALWFGLAVGVSSAAALGIRRPWRWVALGLAVTAAVAGRGLRMDVAWLSVLGDKDYLFPSEWPAYAWLLNLSYPVALWLIHRFRAARGELRPGESAMVLGLLVLVAAFGVSVPLAAARLAWAVQLQVTRVFWVLDAVVVCYVAWWLVDVLGTRVGSRARSAAASILIVLAIGRGAFMLYDTGRPLAQLDLPADEWTDAMTWLRSQPANWQVLADPAHAWRFGSSVRVAAWRDTVLEIGKDSAMAMYDRNAALRVAERRLALAHFGEMSAEEFLDAGRRYDAQVLVAERSRRLPLPVLWSNDRFAIHDLR